ncbi:hypothetical protein [Thiolapillus sp.]|uniref:hypothetical protein n=1 Tax=Thiolapillus sp. TaxID=2017437 RepID=UPI003AF91581
MTQIYIKQNIQKHQTQIFEELVPSVSPLLKKHIRLGHAGIVDHSVDLSIPDLKKSIKKEWTEAIKNSKILYKCITANTPTNCLLLTAKQEPYKKAYLLTKNIEEFSGKSLEERASRQKTIRQKG